jgi:hypothetical protein
MLDTRMRHVYGDTHICWTLERDMFTKTHTYVGHSNETCLNASFCLSKGTALAPYRLVSLRQRMTRIAFLLCSDVMAFHESKFCITLLKIDRTFQNIVPYLNFQAWHSLHFIC